MTSPLCASLPTPSASDWFALQLVLLGHTVHGRASRWGVGGTLTRVMTNNKCCCWADSGGRTVGNHKRSVARRRSVLLDTSCYARNRGSPNVATFRRLPLGTPSMKC